MGRRCECNPCTLPRADGGRCPSTDTDMPGGVVSSHCLACAFCCFDDEGSGTDQCGDPTCDDEHGEGRP